VAVKENFNVLSNTISDMNNLEEFRIMVDFVEFESNAKERFIQAVDKS